MRHLILHVLPATAAAGAAGAAAYQIPSRTTAAALASRPVELIVS